MCTKEDVRSVIRSEAPSKLPPILLNLGVLGVITLMSWMLYTVHQQDKILLDVKSSQQISLAVLTGTVELLRNELKNIKEVAINRSKDRYTGSQARSDKALFTERCNASNRRHDESLLRHKETNEKIDDLSEIVRKHHDGRNL